MWLWQQLHRVPKKYRFIAKLLLFCSCSHGILMFVGLFMYHGNDAFQINLNMTPMTVVFLPFYKSSSAQKVLLPTMPAAPTSHMSTNLTVIKKDEYKKGTTLSKLSIAKKPSTSLVDAKKEIKQKKAAHKKPKVEPKQQEIQKQDKPVEKKVDEKKQELIEDTLIPLSNTLPQAEEVIYAGLAEFDAFELANEIRDEIVKSWKPPVGLSSDQCCKVRVVIDWEGKAQDITIEESSHILAFDTSVRHALLKMSFPKGAYGKELILPFR